MRNYIVSVLEIKGSTLKTKRSLLYAIYLLVMVAILSSCGPSFYGSFMAASPNYTPKTSYTMNKDKLLEQVMSVLQNEEIALQNVDRDNGVIATDYKTGPSVSSAGVAFDYRFKYQISIVKSKKGSTLKIICKFERSSQQADIRASGSGWLDISDDSRYDSYTGTIPQKVRKGYEFWLYEKIEKNI